MLRSLIPSRGDVFGGISAGIVALPLCLAFGAISGLGPEAGLYGAIAAGILAAIFGGTPLLVTGPTNPMTLVAATVVAATMLPSGKVSLAVVVTAFLLAGALQVLLGVLRLGGFIRYVPYPVISGFMSGIGIIIIIQQLYPIVGAEAPSSDAVKILRSLPMLPGGIAWPVALLGAITLAIIQILPWFTRKVPASLIALVVVTAGSVAFGVNAPRIGVIPAGLPALVIPDMTLDQAGLVVSAAIQLAALGAIDTLLSALLADSLTKSHHDSNRELIGQGIGNMGAALVGGLPGAGASIRSIVNIEAGGKTRLSGVESTVYSCLPGCLLGSPRLVRCLSRTPCWPARLVLASVAYQLKSKFTHRQGAAFGRGSPCYCARAYRLLGINRHGLLRASVIASFIFMKKVADISERRPQSRRWPTSPGPTRSTFPPELRDRLLVKNIEGPLFFGFARGFLNIAARCGTVRRRLLISSMDRVSLMDQSGAYALQETVLSQYQVIRDAHCPGRAASCTARHSRGDPRYPRPGLPRQTCSQISLELWTGMLKMLAEIGATKRSLVSKN